MNEVRPSSPRIRGLRPYDPKYLPAQTYLSANENPRDVPEDIRKIIGRAVNKVPLNRYPDPLANELRSAIASANGLSCDWVLLGNGGDELLFDLALAWGGFGRTFLDLPPAFSVYTYNARLTGTAIVEIPRLADFSIDEASVLDRVREGGIDYMVVANPNNPTGGCATDAFIEALLCASDTLIIVDEAYFEFSRKTVRPLLAKHRNLVVLRTFSKAFSLAGVRMGYILAHPSVIRELCKVRQPYSVDAVSQAISQVVFANRGKFEPAIEAILSERDRLFAELSTMEGICPYPSEANWILFKMSSAFLAWEYLYEKGILIRDFSKVRYLEGCLRVTVGLPEENDRFLEQLRVFLTRGGK